MLQLSSWFIQVSPTRLHSPQGQESWQVSRTERVSCWDGNDVRWIWPPFRRGLLSWLTVLAVSCFSAQPIWDHSHVCPGWLSPVIGPPSWVDWGSLNGSFSSGASLWMWPSSQGPASPLTSLCVHFCFLSSLPRCVCQGHSSVKESMSWRTQPAITFSWG